MGKAKGVSKRRRKAGSFHYKTSKKLKRQRLRELRKCGPVNCDIIRNAWDQKKSLKNNMKNMGLSEDPNRLLSEPKFYEKFKNVNKEDDYSNNIALRLHQMLKQKQSRSNKLKKLNQFDVEMIDSDNNKEKTVAEKLSEMAEKPRNKNFRFGPDQVKFCIYMIEKYGDDYEGMARDKINYYQESAGQIRAKINKFLKIPTNRNVYEKVKQLCNEKLNL